MTNAYTLRNHFTLGNYNTTITRSEFEDDGHAIAWAMAH